MKDRLIELLDGFVLECVNNCPKIIEGTRKCHKCAYGKIADYLIANGVIVPPCKVGDKVFKPWKAGGRDVIAEFVVVAIISGIRDDWCIKYKKIGGTICYQMCFADIGKTVFLTREDAEKALKRKDEGK